MTMIYIRADGNPKIGSGHIMRCLSLADGFRKIGQDAVFITADNHFQDVIQKRGYRCIVLHTEYHHMENELPVLRQILQTHRPRCILLDSYYVTPSYMAAIRQKAPLIYIDDQNAFDYPADIVVNYTLYADKLIYPPNKRYLFGPEYALLREEFQGVPRRQAAEQVRHVLLSAGGADPEHVALGVVRYLREQWSDSVTYHVVLGAMNQDTEAIESIAAGLKHIVLHRQVSDMCSLMLKCDAAVSAGGTTLFELCACGVPTVTYVLADNQIMNAVSFEETGLMLCAGDIRKDDRFAPHIFEKLDVLMQNQPLRQRMIERMQALVDGCGAKRLAKAIVEFI